MNGNPLSSVWSALEALARKVWPSEPRPMEDQGGDPQADMAPPEADASEYERLAPDLREYEADEPWDDETEKDRTGQIQTEVDRLATRILALEEEVALRKQERGDDQSLEPLPDDQVLCKLQENIAAGAAGSVKQAVYQGGSIVEFGPAYTAFNCGQSDGSTGDVALLQQGDHSAPCFQIARGQTVVDQTQIVDSETATAGTASTPPRSDGKQGFKCVRHDAAADAIDDTATLYQSIEAVKKSDGTRRGFRVKCAPYSGGSPNKSALGVDANGVHVPTDSTGGLTDDGAGPKVNANLNLYLSGGTLNARCGWAVGDFKLRYATGDIANSPPGFWWLECDGGSFSADDYPDLNTLLGGTTLPDTRRRFLMGCHPGDMTYGLASNEGVADVASRTPSAHGHANTLSVGAHDLSHTHGVTVTGHTIDSGDASSAQTGGAIVGAAGLALDDNADGFTDQHYHEIPADAFQHHTHGWVQDTGVTGAASPDLSNVTHSVGGSVTDKSAWPPWYGMGVYILAKKTA